MAGLSWDDIQVGVEVAPLELLIKYDMVAGAVAARDWFPGHHEPAYAATQGRPNIYANTVFLQGFVDRTALRWAGPHWFVHKRKLKMHQSVYPDKVLVATGRVTGKSDRDSGMLTVSIELLGHQENSHCISADVTVAFGESSNPRHAGKS